jgi:hypothetical protein
MRTWIPEVTLAFREQASDTVITIAVSTDPALVKHVSDALKTEADLVAAKSGDDAVARSLLEIDAARVRASIEALAPKGVPEPAREEA